MVPGLSELRSDESFSLRAPTAVPLVELGDSPPDILSPVLLDDLVEENVGHPPAPPPNPLDNTEFPCPNVGLNASTESLPASLNGEDASYKGLVDIPLPPDYYSFDPLASPDEVTDRSISVATQEETLPPPDFLDYDQSYFQNRIPKRKRSNPSLDPNHKKPDMIWEYLPVYNLDETTAPRQNFLMVCERPSF